MGILWYFFIGYLVIINIVTLVVYVKEVTPPSPRLPGVVLILLPIIGGSVGAVIANYFKNVENRELRCWLNKPLGYIPPTMLIVHFILILYFFGIKNCISFVCDHVYAQAGVIGYVLLVINAITFLLVIIRKSAYYFAPWWTDIIPDFILIPFLIFGGATGGVIAKILFNFKEDWTCNVTKKFQNFLYNHGMFLVSAVHVFLYIYFLFIR